MDLIDFVVDTAICGEVITSRKQVADEGWIWRLALRKVVIGEGQGHLR
ncbi:Uncharacterised protein [Chlamydia trachomatis]|nr:Uncharacterised protein [Chlamydia trachomatis]